MKSLLFEIVPRKYRVLYNAGNKGIEIEISDQCIASALVMKDTDPMVMELAKQHGADDLFSSFDGNLKGEVFGFNKSLHKINQRDGYTMFLAPFPEITKVMNNPCPRCAGTGEEPSSGTGPGTGVRCRSCHGLKQEVRMDEGAGYRTTASLSLLFRALEMCQDTSVEETQSMEVRMISKVGPHGSSVSGRVGISIMKYFRTPNEFELRDIILKNTRNSMIETYGRMMVCHPGQASAIRADVHEGFMSLDCPGQGCGIVLSGSDGPEQGRNFSSHNVDSPAQALTLLAGLASMVMQVEFFAEAKEVREKADAVN